MAVLVTCLDLNVYNVRQERLGKSLVKNLESIAMIARVTLTSSDMQCIQLLVSTTWSAKLLLFVVIVVAAISR